MTGAKLHEPTFLFADLAGFTALTEAMGDHEAADVAADFCAAAHELLDDHHAEEAKAIGDALMLPRARSRSSCRARIADRRGRGLAPLLPGGACWVAYRAAIERDGDWFGAAVNLASRV